MSFARYLSKLAALLNSDGTVLPTTLSAGHPTWDSSGNVGIGTSSPARVFDARGASSNFGNAFLVDTTTGGAAGVGGGVIFGANDGSGAFPSYAAVQGIKENSTVGNAAGAVLFATKNAAGTIAERARIDSSGNLLVGGTTAGAKLRVTGAKAWFSTTETGGSGIPIVIGNWNTTEYAPAMYMAGDVGSTQKAWRVGPTYSGASGQSLTFGYSTADQAYGSDPTALTYSEKMRLDSSGNLGIGTNSPWRKLAVQVAGSGTNYVAIGCDGGPVGVDLNPGMSATQAATYDPQARIYAADSNWSANIIFASKTPGAVTNTLTERMRIDTIGSLLVGTTSAISGPGTARITAQSVSTGWFAAAFEGYYGVGINAPVSGDNSFLYFYYRSNGSPVGRVYTNGTTTTYGTTSDYRMKEAVAPMVGAIAKVMELKPCTYVWKSTQEAGCGFIAHELQEVIPEAVAGEKDDVFENGQIKPQMVDAGSSSLIATLTAAIQEQQAIIEALTQRVAALEA